MDGPMVILLTLALGCQRGEIPQMDATVALQRVSMEIRGTRPSLEEIAQIVEDPAALESMIDLFMDDPRYMDRIVAIYSEIYLTRADYFWGGVLSFHFGIDDQAAFLDAVGHEPLKLVGQVATTDRPWTEIVTADWTMANEVLGEIWPVDYPEGGTGWVEVHHTDDRPAAGVLATTSMWWRHISTPSNANRGRANLVSRILLCDDYLNRVIQFDRDLDMMDEDALAQALTTNPACVNCHASLDPLAGFFYGFWQYAPTSLDELSVYHADREQLWQTYGGIPPAYFGTPADSLPDLAQLIAADPRFVSCAVEQAWEGLMRRPATLGDMDRLTVHREAFLAGGLRHKALVRSILSDPWYRAGATDVEGAVPTKIITPDQLDSSIRDLTGFEWTTQGGYPMLGSDRYGVRTLAGGADAVEVTSTNTRANPTTLLVQQRLAQMAATYAVEREQGMEAATRTLFRRIDFTESDAGAVREQLQDLHLRVLGQDLAEDDANLEASVELWSALHADGHSVPDCWAALLSTLLRDPAFLYI
jgi:hypothetical protein